MRKVTEKGEVWMPMQTIYNKELALAEFLKGRSLRFYIPMTYELADAGDGSGRCRPVLVPAVHNLVFVRHSYDAEWCRGLVREAPVPMYFLKREREGSDFCIVGDREMENFMRATDPEIRGTRFIDPQKLLGKRSVPVRVVRKGPLYGVTGRFLRFGGRHYIAVELPQSTALLKVSFTWCEILAGQEAANG